LINHRWSGWPGAWCLDCGESDPAEECIATHDGLDYKCSLCGEHWPQGKCSIGGDHDIVETPCSEHQQTECKEPLSHNHDPYFHEKENLDLLIGGMFK
jgi:hypothetical protein